MSEPKELLEPLEPLEPLELLEPLEPLPFEGLIGAEELEEANMHLKSIKCPSRFTSTEHFRQSFRSAQVLQHETLEKM